MLNMPVAIWGVIGYSFIFILLFFAGSNSAGKVRIWSLIFWVAFIFSGHSVILALISTYRIRSYCILCIVSYGVNLALLFYAPLQTLLDRQRGRGDAAVPDFAVKNIWNAISQPQIGEFDEILVIE